jgi:protein phosphatase
MPDPLYILTAIVAIGLVAWVLLALIRPGPAEVADAAPKPARADVPPAGATDATAKPAEPAPDAPAKVSEAAPPAPTPAAAKPVVTVPTPTDTQLTKAPAEPVPEDDPTGPNALILVTAVGRTDPGLRRSHNEDAYAILEDKKLFVIADGMGKHAAGEVASKLAVDAITDAFRSGVTVDPAVEPKVPQRAARLRAAILEANRKVLATAQDNDRYTGMGTTVVSAYFSPSNQRVYVAHVGDSRCYRLRDDELHQLTMDHTLGAAGITGKSSVLLSRAVGVEPNVDVDVLVESPHVGDIYLLCSDGLSRMVEDELIKATLKDTKDLEDATRILIAMANEQGGRDNITAILVRVDSPLATS